MGQLRLLSARFKPGESHPQLPAPHLATKKNARNSNYGSSILAVSSSGSRKSTPIHCHEIDDRADRLVPRRSRRAIPPQSILPKTGPRAVHLQRQFHPGPPPMLHLLIAINRLSAPLRGEEVCLIGIRVSIPLWGLIIPGHLTLAICAFSRVARHSWVSVDPPGHRCLLIPTTTLTLLMPCLLILPAVGVRAHCTLIITYVDTLLCAIYL